MLNRACWLVGVPGLQRFWIVQIGMGFLYLFIWGLILIGSIADPVRYRTFAFECNQKVAQQIASNLSIPEGRPYSALRLVASLGLFVTIVNTMALLFGNENRLGGNVTPGSFKFGGIILTKVQAIQITVGIAAILALRILSPLGGPSRHSATRYQAVFTDVSAVKASYVRLGTGT